jgi:pimeloyl-ACP methyl ester carboxylesterase
MPRGSPSATVAGWETRRVRPARLRSLLLAGLLLVPAWGSDGPGSAGSPTTDPVTTTAPVEDTVEGSGVPLRVRAAGGDGGITTILVHGGPGLSLEAMAVYEELSGPDHRVVSYDQRGSGRSGEPADGAFGLDAHVADLEAVRAWTGAATVSVVGQSWGGAVAAAYAAEHPERVTTLVLVGAVPLDGQAFLEGQARFRARVAALQEEGLIPDPLPRAGGGSCLPPFEAALPAYAADPAEPPDVRAPSCSAAASRASYEALGTPGALEPWAARLARFRGRALVVMGEADPFGLAWLDRTAALLTGADVETQVVEGAGHLVGAERPEPLLAAIQGAIEG